MRLLQGAALALSAAACAAELPPPSRVDALRLIALLTETPDVRPGEGFAVRALWFDPRGRAAQARWSWCWEAPGIDPLRCAAGEGAHAISETGDVATVPPDALRDRPTGVDAVIVVARIEVGADRFEGFRRVRVRAQGALNQPPEIVEVAVGEGAARVVIEEGEVREGALRALRVELVAADGAREPTEAGGAEVLTASFLASAGAFDPPRVVGGERAFVARWTGDAVGDVRFWAVLRDDRGGVRARAWTMRLTR